MSATLEPGATGRIIDPYAAYGIVSRVGMRGGRMHNGEDLLTPTGTPAYALDGGVVTGSGWSESGGWGVTIRHGYTASGDPIESYQAHFRDEPTLRIGETVQQGQQIGVTGATGIVEGPHVHVEFWDGYTPVSYTDIVQQGGRYADGAVQDTSRPGRDDAPLAMGRENDPARVRSLQQTLQAVGYDVEVDGTFGQGTHDAVVNFQSLYRKDGAAPLEPDGVVGPATFAALGEVRNRMQSRDQDGLLVASAGPLYVGSDTIPPDPSQIAFVREMDARVDALVGDRLSETGREAVQALAAQKGADLTTADVRASLERTDPGSTITGSDLVHYTVAARSVGEMQQDPLGAAAVREARPDQIRTMEGDRPAIPAYETPAPGQSAMDRIAASPTQPSQNEPLVMG